MSYSHYSFHVFLCQICLYHEWFIKIEKLELKIIDQFLHAMFCLYQSILSKAMTIHRKAGKGRRQSLYYSLPLLLNYKQIWTFICNFACDMAATYF